jgi:WD40 repeat protein
MFRHYCLASGVCGIALFFLWLNYSRTGSTETPAAWRELRALHGHRSPILAMAFSPDGRRVVSGDFDSNVRVWDCHSGRWLPSEDRRDEFSA